MTKEHNVASQPKLKLCRVMTVPQIFQTLLWEQLRCIVAHGIELTLVCSLGIGFAGVIRDVGAKGVAIAMAHKSVRHAIRIPSTRARIDVLVARTSFPAAKLACELGFVPQRSVPRAVSELAAFWQTQ